MLKNLNHTAQHQSQMTVTFTTKMFLQFHMFAEVKIYTHLLGYEKCSLVCAYQHFRGICCLHIQNISELSGMWMSCF